MESSLCPACNASTPPGAKWCPSCGQRLSQPSPPAPPPQPAAQPASAAGPVIFRRQSDPSENAFTISIPQGWLVEGGIQRADHMRQLVSAQTIEAKVDFAVKRDPHGSVMIRWCPEIKYADVSGMPGGVIGFFPPGSNYQGMIVSPVIPAVPFLAQVVFPWAHPAAVQARLVDQEPLPDQVQLRLKQQAATGLPWQFAFDAAQVTFEYEEQGVRYLERATVVIESRGPQFAGAWSNRETLFWRAPAGEMDRWEPVLHHIRESVVPNPEWQAQEQLSQQVLMQSFRNAQEADRARAQARLDTQHYVQQVAREIAEHHERTQAEIRNDHYLLMTNQEEFVNPYSGKVDLGSNQWRQRWVSADGDELYTDDDSFDPNTPGVLDRRDWRRTPVRPRFPT